MYVYLSRCLFLFQSNEIVLQQHIEDVIVKSTKSSENLVQTAPTSKKNNVQVYNRSYSIA